MKRIAIQQSDYIPWKGYFDIIRSVDEFIIYDNVQYTRRDWRNRNKIKTPDGTLWLTIPVKVKGKYHQMIKETETADSLWAEKHWKAICLNYAGTPYFDDYKILFREAYEKAGKIRMLSEINFLFIELINSIIGIKTRISRAEDYSSAGVKSERILSICRDAGADKYLTGPSGLKYLDNEKFAREGIKICIADYTGYPEYNQPWPPFTHFVSIIDLIFSEGKNCLKYMKTF